MKNKRMIGLAALVLLLAVSGTLFAQNLPPSGFHSSPTSSSTAGRFASDADMFMWVDSYNGVEFDKWFGFASFASTTTARLGYATKVNDIYIGAYYNGRFWTNLEPITSRKENVIVEGLNKEMPVYASVPSFSGSYPLNHLAVLVGVADMGFRFSFASTHRAFNKKEFIEGTATVGTYYKKYQTELGWLSPEIAWGMAKPLADFGIQPTATIGLNFYRDYTKGTSKTGTTEIEKLDNSANYFKPAISLGLGGITLADKDGFSAGADLDLSFDFDLYTNEYLYADSSGAFKIAKGLKGTYTNGNLLEKSVYSIGVFPSVSTGWSNDRLALKAKLNLGLGFDGNTSTEMALKNPGVDSALQKQGSDTKISNFSFTPALALGMQWQVVPEKLTLNAGGTIYTGVELKTTESSEYDAAGEKIKGDDTTQHETKFTRANTALMLGVNFNPAKNLGFEASAGVNSTNNAINVFASSGLFYFSQILVSLKF